MDVEVNSPDETEDEITSSYEFLPPLKRFTCEDINPLTANVPVT